jgi:hypothetical protein
MVKLAQELRQDRIVRTDAQRVCFPRTGALAALHGAE